MSDPLTMEYIKHHYSHDALFIDEEFPPLKSSLGEDVLNKAKELNKPIIWKRPRDIVKDPKFIIDGLSADDINIGNLIQDDWFVFALESLVERGILGDDWTSKHQGFDKVRYTGAFEFIFFKQGKYTRIIIDDFLPTVDGKLVGISSCNHREFWSALMEKAYAKLNGSYSDIAHAKAVDIFLEISGFFPLKIITKNINPNNLALCIDQGILINTGVESVAMPSAEREVEGAEGMNFQLDKEYLNYNFSILRGGNSSWCVRTRPVQVRDVNITRKWPPFHSTKEITTTS